MDIPKQRYACCFIMAAIVKKKSVLGKPDGVGVVEEVRGGGGRKARWGRYLVLGKQQQQTHIILLITRKWILPATGLPVRQPCSLYSCNSAEFNLTGYMIHLPVLLLELLKSSIVNFYFSKPLGNQSFIFVYSCNMNFFLMYCRKSGQKSWLATP